MQKNELFEIICGKEKWDVYQRFQQIEMLTKETNELYQYFDDFEKLLNNEKDYIKMRSFVIICALSKWDTYNKINNIIDKLLAVLDSDTPTLVRICLKKLDYLLIYKQELSKNIEFKLKQMNYFKYKETMQPLIEKDINILLEKINQL